MKRFLILILVACFTLPLCAADASLDLSGATKEDLLEWKTQIDNKLSEMGWYPFQEIDGKTTGEQVLRLQERLTDLNYYTKEPTGKYDSNTSKAFAEFMKAQGFKAGKTVTIENQEFLFSSEAIAKPTPTPPPTPTPAPTPIPDEAVLEITSISLFTRYGYPKFRVEAKNHSKEYTIDAFDLMVMGYDHFGQVKRYDGDIYVKFTENNCKIKPGGTYKMGGQYWDLFGWDTATKIKVAITRYHTSDGKTVDVVNVEDLIFRDDVWIEGTLK